MRKNQRNLIVIFSTAAVLLLIIGCTPQSSTTTPISTTTQSSMSAQSSTTAQFSTATSSPERTDQGSKWTPEIRNKFYTQDQGSHLIPLKWALALKQKNGEPFMADSLQRYGYLPNPDSPEPGLPVGFTTGQTPTGKMLGMTCSACHTREIEVEGKAYRIDGGPAISDFQVFMIDLDLAVNTLLTDTKAFSIFADSVLGSGATNVEKEILLGDLATWYLPYHTIVKGSFADNVVWGPGRLDAIAMILNRVSGLDIGTAPDHIIKENIKRADAPVRYPFLWNASVQDFTQWPGFSPNGNRIFALTRNLGEVFGVFGEFHPVKDKHDLLKINYVKNNSANFSGLNKLENLIMKLDAPKWPWKIDQALAAQGKIIFDKKDIAQGNSSCSDCHGIKKGEFRSFSTESWKTPIMDVGTDTREANLLKSTVKTGVLEGAVAYPGATPLKAVDSAVSVLGVAVIGSILQHYLPVRDDSLEEKALTDIEKFESKVKSEIAKIENEIDDDIEKPGSVGTLDDLKKSLVIIDSKAVLPAYESRVLQGIWAVAPYLHNGSVPTLSELLKPDSERVESFSVGPEYDIENVGLSATQKKFNYILKTSGCEKINSGDSRCGHNFGTSFPAAEKKALLEYLKTL